MTETTLRDLVLKRLEADTQPVDEWAALVLAALGGPDELDQLLASGNGTPKGETPDRPNAQQITKTPATPRTAFLRRITAQGFRGIGLQATLDLTPGPGLTLVVGRNGSGKSSFAEGLELLLTGDTYRWSQRSKVWRDGWRNLHHPKAALAAEFALEGERGACTLTREWADGAELTDASTWAQVHGQPRTGPEALGWEVQLEAYRPRARRIQREGSYTCRVTISERIRENRSNVLRIATRHGARNVRVIGSVARGESTPNSDLDLLVELEEGRSLFDHAALILELESLLACKVDVATEKGLRPRVRDRVLEEAVPL